MIDITFEFDTEGEELPDALMDRYELEMMLEHTRASIRNEIERKLATVVCDEHHQAPSFKISGTYSNETEQMELNYHIDTCCQLFLLRVIKTLNMKA